MTGPREPESRAFCLAVVPGVTIAKWGRAWAERHPEIELRLVRTSAADQDPVLRAGLAEVGLVRLPVDRETFDAIPLYTETTVVVVARDHVVTAAEEVRMADLVDEVLLLPLDNVLPGLESWGGAANLADRPDTTANAMELVAAGVGVLVVPQSLARAHLRKDVAHRPVTDAPTASIGLAWVRERYSELIEDMIGIVRGRTVNSSRGQAPRTPEPLPPPTRGKIPQNKSSQNKSSQGKSPRAQPSPRGGRRRRGR